MQQKQQTDQDNVVKIPLAHIHTDGGTQARAGLNEDAVADYADAFRRDVVLPPVVVFFDGETYWLADGFHRLAAAVKAELDELWAEVRQGTQRDAFLYACEANQSHGVRPTRVDKRHAVEKMLRDAEWVKWSDREIARRCGTSKPFVSKVRADLTATDNVISQPERIGRDGRIINTANIGKGSAAEEERDIPLGLIRFFEPSLIRGSLEHGIIEAYAEYMRAGAVFPPVLVFQDGDDYWLADGAHRVKAAQLRRAKLIRASVRQGTRRDAIFAACGANANWDKSPLSYTINDLRHRVSTAISLQPPLVDAEIAALVGVSLALVAEIRAGKAR